MQTNYVTLAIGLIGAINTTAMVFGWYHLNNEQLDAVDKLVSVVAMGLGVVLSHQKPVTEQPQQSENAPN